MKIINWILSMICCCYPCQINEEISQIKIGNSILQVVSQYKYSCIGFPFQATIVKEKGNYVFAISNNKNTIFAIAIFSSSKKLLYSSGITPIDDENITKAIVGKTMHEIKKQYGNVHFDIGSGRYIPTYITKNAKILSLFGNSSLEDDNEIIKDIIIEDIIDKYFPV